LILIPAIDILNKQCVRLLQGNYNKVSVYSDSPEEIARSFEEKGALQIHIVDLDAAKGKGDHNRDTIAKIRNAVSCTIEVGGGVRSEEDIDALLAIGINKLIFGTILAKDPDLIARWVSRFGDCFIAGIDARDGKVKIQGWKDDSGLSDTECSLRAKSLGIREIIYTNISNDGALKGPDIERTNLIAETAGIPVILSGGIGAYNDIERAIARCNPLVTGIIIGKAIYEGNIALDEAFRRFQQAAS
jgi:phosphoribosylformimino-5-aminoimidazole carboxamide ribotide isomerase